MSNETEANDLPSLKFLDQTPILNKQDAKQAKPDSSPSSATFDEDLFLSKID